MVRFIHTADLQIGELFAQFPEDRSWELRKLRLEALKRLAETARAEAADFVVCAGDFFDENTLENRTVEQTSAILRSFPVPLFVLPGNHDHGGPDSIWRRRAFDPGPNVRVLESPEPVVVAGGRAVILPCPLLRRHTSGDPTAHLTADTGREVAPDAVRIGLAHGAVHGFGQEEGDLVNRIDLARVTEARLDYLALGDWHGFKAFGDRACYPGTPEPDSFAGNETGQVLVVQLDGPGARPEVRKVRTARARWESLSRPIYARADVAALEAAVRALGDPGNLVLELTLEGALALGDRAEFDRVLSRLEGELLALKRGAADGIRVKATDEELDAMAVNGFVRVAVDRLRAVARGGGAEAEDAERALQLLHGMVTGN